MHSYLIVGGTGKTRREHAFEKLSTLLHLPPSAMASHPDVFILEGKTVPIHAVRTLREWVARKPFQGTAKAALILAAHRLTLPAQQALLKTLEEPPQETFLVLTAPSEHLLLPTVVSRCEVQRLASQPLKTTGTLVTLLKQTSTPAERFHLASRYASPEKALRFVAALIRELRSRLYHNESLPPGSLEEASRAYKRLKANVNVRLTLERLLLKL